LTDENSDFANHLNGTAVLRKKVKVLIVIKKNTTRLKALRDWLKDIPLSVRSKTPVLLLDDEADQATPNSASGREEHTRINQLVREIWKEIPTGNYVGYTATPFANVFMDPSDEEELYPSDFIIDLPRPNDYFGAERIFGREPMNDADDPDPGLNMIRLVSEDEASLLKPPGRVAERAEFDPDLPPSLVDAVVWFLVATAIRWARGQEEKHSSMLVHTTHYVAPHQAMGRRIEHLLDELSRQWASGRRSAFEASFNREAEAVASVATKPLPSWDDVAERIADVLARARTVGRSRRLWSRSAAAHSPVG